MKCVLKHHYNFFLCKRWERRGEDAGDSRRGRREEWGEGGGGGKWKHDMFEQLEKEEQEDEIQAETR